MTRLRGWAPRGERLVDKVPQGKWKTATFLAALRNDRIDAPCLFDGPINGERFHAYVEQFLVPTLKPGDVVILDNLGSHKGKAVRRTIRNVGLPSCSCPNTPRPQPIEQVFAKFKTLLRKAGARSYEAISDACGEILAQPARRMRRIPQERRIRVDPKARRSRSYVLICSDKLGARPGLGAFMRVTGWPPRRRRGRWARKQMAPQVLENARFAEENGSRREVDTDVRIFFSCGRMRLSA